MTVKELADVLGVPVKDVLAKLLAKRLMLTINSPLDTEIAAKILWEFRAQRWMGGRYDPRVGGSIDPRADGSSDPRAGGVREPAKHGPSGSLSAAAVPEPDDDDHRVNAVGKSPDSRG
jgi:hypothetical protein